MPALEYIADDVTTDLIPLSTTLLKSIQSLELQRLPNLKGWWKDAEEDEYILPPFHCLSSLWIDDCPKLTFMPLFTCLKKWLRLKNTDWKLFQQTMMNTVAEPVQVQTSPPFTPLSNLRVLEICKFDDLQSVSECLRSLTFLRMLSIGECPKLKHLSPDIEHLTLIEKLLIYKHEQLDFYNGGGITWQALKSLRYLKLDSLPQLETLPDGLQYVTGLQFLYSSGCNSLVSIPEWISNLKSLKQFEIFTCAILASLPEGMHFLTSLQTLCILDCPIYLITRCPREMGEDWPMVAHIPELHLPSTSTGINSPSSSASSGNENL